MVGFVPPEAVPRSGLGTNGISVTPLRSRKSRESFREARRQRFERRSVSSRWLVDDAVAQHGAGNFVEHVPAPGTCGWNAGEAVGVHKAEGGPARYSGVQSCSSVWSCACCGALIRGERSKEVQAAAEWWEKQGGQFLFLTLTVRHYAEDTLARTMDAVTGAFTDMINGAPWKRFARTHGIRHFIKSQEVTLGWENGWHAHLHVLLLVDLPGAARDAAVDAELAWEDARSHLTKSGRMNATRVKKAQRRDELAAEAKRVAEQGIGDARRKELGGWLSERWATMVVANGGRRPSRRRGVDIRTVHDGKVVALYVSKLQEGDRRAAWGVGNELARQDMKKGRADSLVPLELLDVDGLTADELERNRLMWLEYVASTKGRRAMTWSRGLKELAGIVEVSDDEILDAEAADVVTDDRVIIIRAAAWRRIQYNAVVLARVLELVESDRLDEVTALVPWEYPPPDPGTRVTPLTGAERLAAAYGRTRRDR